VRHIAVPYVNVRPAIENQVLMVSLRTIAPNIRTIYLGTKLNVPAESREPRY
jgi:hypothetical protein